ncbi:MAG TPA: FKBP-type peptidyl-prolyl cis-trans isomerase [Buchnera sp. (in: enterobacteria)]|nr:FKBP-type peptidyl-prolyl cis-trans isomerase [Buchnera sp. (in: enterobacteria)]
MNIIFLNFFHKILSMFRYISFSFFIFFIPCMLWHKKSSMLAISDPVLSKINNVIFFKDEHEKTSYALGVSLGNYIERSLIEQKQLGIFLDKKKLLLGIQDTMTGLLKLSKEEITEKLQHLESKLQYAEKVVLKKYTDENYINGASYLSQFIKQNNAEKTDTGLVFLINNLGNGKYPIDTDMVSVNYIGHLIDGSEFDNSYIKGQPIWLALKDVIPGWKEGIKHIKKGGRIKLLIPPYLAYGKDGVPGIPGNSTLIFDIELLDIKSL